MIILIQRNSRVIVYIITNIKGVISSIQKKYFTNYLINLTLRFPQIHFRYDSVSVTFEKEFDRLNLTHPRKEHNKSWILDNRFRKTH